MKNIFWLSLALAANACFAQIPSRYDIIIDEIMADPSPPNGLPNVEWLELKNISSTSWDLKGFSISDGSSIATIAIHYYLMPDSFVALTSNSGLASLQLFGPAIGVSNFPSLDNNADLAILFAPDSSIIHAVAYTNTWYKNDLKKEGGWSLEMIDCTNPASGIGNWRASINSKGGTPGRINSVDGSNPDRDSPSLLYATVSDSMHIILQFNEPMDAYSSLELSNYAISNLSGSVSSARQLPPLFDAVEVAMSLPMEKNKIYSVSVGGIKDCSGNSMDGLQTIRVGLPVIADSLDIIVNEILFNPKPGGVDYVELYNRSNHIINLRELYLSNKNTAPVLISKDQKLFFPGDYIVVTVGCAIVASQYELRNPENCIEISSMPSFPDDRGTVLLLNLQGNAIDQLNYDSKWHFALISDDEGIALERIHFESPTQDPLNWHSASGDAGYGTPARQNSQFRNPDTVKGELHIEPAIFSPDNDGFDDFLVINYQFPDPGYVCNLNVYDANGRLVKYIARNSLCGTHGYFRWDGLDEKYQRLNVGIYIVAGEVFDLKGKSKKFKQAVVLAKRF